MQRFKTFGQRFCTYCGTNQMYYIHFKGRPLGTCECGNMDWCEGETEAEVKKRYGKRLFPANIEFLEVND